MNRTAWSMASLVLIVALTLMGRVEAQQNPQHHPEGAPASQEQSGEETQEEPDQAPMGQGMMQQMQGMMQQMQGMMQQMHGRMGRGGMKGRGMMRNREDDASSGGRGMMGRGMMRGHGGMMGHMQRKMARLTEQLDLTDEQQSKVQALLRNHVKEGIRFKADIDTTSIDLQQLLDAQSIDMAKVKTTLQTIAGKEADLRLTHIAAMQDIRKLLTPEQQKQFRAVRGHMMDGGGKMAHRGMKGRGGMKMHGKQMGRGGMKGQGGMKNPCGMQRGKSDK